MFGIFKTKKNYENLSATAFKQMMKDHPEAVILDVRTAPEFKQGALPKAKNIDLMDAQFSQKINALDKTKPYLVYCRSGNRSGSACKFMGENGFTQVYNLAGGMMGW